MLTDNDDTRVVFNKGLVPEIVPSTFEENLPKSEFTGEGVYEYPVQTGYKKVSAIQGADTS